MIISSANNAKLKLVRALVTTAKTRKEEGKFALEGTRLIFDVIQQGFRPSFVLYKADQEDLIGNLKEVECLPVEPRLFDDLSDTETPQGLLAVFPIPALDLPSDASLVLAVDGLNDPGNLGTILRTGAAAGVDGVVLLPGTVDAFNPKVVRAGMGAHFRLPIFSFNWDLLKGRFGAGWHFCSADANEPTARPYDEPLWHQPTVLVVGNEAHGLSNPARQLTQQFVSIPMAKGVESLNSAIAAAILLFEIRRQRAQK